ncbi:hypothetical protein CK203_046775 [Vitis vinifera]|uniref:Uncharacterized protein n=1 Tax=Vitis vinifera TaxID=29760 RepID=A0A438H1W6_VITVI|nr:hypothetical protein CK203_046775 [Vitis vinifera]
MQPEKSAFKSTHIDGAEEEHGNESRELSKRTKRLSIEVGPSSFASRKKKSKTNSKC